MEGYISYVASIFTILILLTSAEGDEFYCCGPAFAALNLSNRKCENGRDLQLPCEEVSSVPAAQVNQTRFTMDGKKKYLILNGTSTAQLSPYCMAHVLVNGTVDGNMSVIYCSDHLTWRDYTPVRHQQLQFHQDIIDSIHFDGAEISLYSIACIISGVLLAIVAALYISVPQTDDLVEKCAFHVALSQSFFYFGCAWASVVLQTGFVEPYLGNFCVVFWYLFVFVELSSFTWCTVLAYHLRKTFIKNSSLSGFKCLCQYLMIGYGIPALLVILCNIHVLANSYLRNDALELSCNAQFDLMSVFYGFLPLIIISLTNICLFISIQRQLSKVEPNSLEFSVTSMERFKFRLSFSKKLFILLILPWLVIAFLGLPMEMFKSILENHESLVEYMEYLVRGIYFLLCSEGVIMFCVLSTSHTNL